MSVLELIAVLLTAVALLGYFNHRVLRLPDTIGITAVGVLVCVGLALGGRAVPGAAQWAQALAGRFDFPELVLHGLLSVLLFAGSLHVSFGDLARQKWPVLVLSTIGVVLSTVLVGFGTWSLLRVAGLNLSLMHCLLFGALISPTYPIAVLGVLKTVGFPRSLETDIAGESLFNDGTGVVAFLVLLGIVNGGADPSVEGVALLLVREIAGALLLGLAAGYVAFVLLHGVDSYPVEIIITLALATASYALADRLGVSAPLAVVTAGLVIGNHGVEHAMSERTREHLLSFWDLLDEVLNLVLFGMVGLLLVGWEGGHVAWSAAALLIPVVLAARFVSVGVPAVLLRPWLKRRTPHAVKVLTWGGLRGGISIALALTLPAFQGRDTLVMGTFAVVFFSLLVQATTLQPLLRRLGLGQRLGS